MDATCQYETLGRLAIELIAPNEPTPFDTNNDPPLRGLKRAPMAHADEVMSVAEGRAAIEQAITEYLQTPKPGHMLLVAAPAGIGKTTMAVKIAERLANTGYRGMYVGPRREFYLEDIAPIAQRPQWWYDWQSRHDGGKAGLDATCRWSSQIRKWQERGYKSIDFCCKSSVCGWDYIQNSCKYYKQQNLTEPLIHVQYEHITLGHPLLEDTQFLIGDELPIRAFLAPWHIPAEQIMPRDVVDGDLAKLLRRLVTLTKLGETFAGKALLDRLDVDVIALQEEYKAIFAEDVIPPDLRDANDVDSVDYNHLPITLGLLSRLAQTVARGQEPIERIRVNKEGLTLLARRTPKSLPDHVVWLDATANAPLYETLFGMPVKVVRPKVAMAGTIYQVYSGLNNKTTVAQSEAKREHLKQQVSRVIETRGYQNVAYVSYKDWVDFFAGDTELFAHFGGNRGTNKLAECDALMVIGAPMPPAYHLIELAAMLYDERDHAFDTTWTQIDRPYHDQPFAWPTGGYWNDPDLQQMLIQMRDAELVQALHRARPLVRNVDVWLLTNVPLDGIPVELISVAELMGAPQGVDLYRWQNVSKTANEIAKTQGFVTSADLVKAGLGKPQACRNYIDQLIQAGWKELIIRGRGRASRAAMLLES